MTQSQTVPPSPALPQGEAVFNALASDAEALAQSLDDHIRRNVAPQDEKTLRPFQSSEVAEFLGLSVTHLRKMHFDGKIPEVPADSRGRRLYTAADIHAIRQCLAQSARNPLQYLPGRRAGDAVQVLAVSTFKGGAAKSTLTAHLVQKYALQGYRVLAIDMDPQASLSTLLGLRPELNLLDEGTIFDAIRYDEDRRPMSEVVKPTYFQNLDLASGGLILSEFETETAHALNKGGDIPFYLRLRAAIDEVEASYDIVLIDCPPALGFLTLSALVAASALVIPVVANMIDIASLGQYLRMATALLSEIQAAGEHLDYDFMKYVLCRFEPSDGPQAQMAAFLRVHFEKRVLTETFLKSTLVSDAGMTQQTLYEIERATVNRNTYDRAIDSINAVARELEQSIQRAWGRN